MTRKAPAMANLNKALASAAKWLASPFQQKAATGLASASGSPESAARAGLRCHPRTVRRGVAEGPVGQQRQGPQPPCLLRRVRLRDHHLAGHGQAARPRTPTRSRRHRGEGGDGQPVSPRAAFPNDYQTSVDFFMHCWCAASFAATPTCTWNLTSVACRRSCTSCTPTA
jgi:hypothetical protein